MCFLILEIQCNFLGIQNQLKLRRKMGDWKKDALFFENILKQ